MAYTPEQTAILEREPLPAAGTTSAEVADVITFLCSPRSVAINGDAVAAGGGTPGVTHY